MPSEAMLSEISTRLFPDLAAFTAAAKKEWRPEIHNVDLRAEILANPRLTQTILTDLLAADDKTAKSTAIDSVQLDAFADLIDADLESVIRRLGMIWHAEQLAGLTSSGEIFKILPGVDVEEVRFALSLREQGALAAAEAPDFEAAITKSGREILSAWLNETPKPMRQLLQKLNGALGEIYRQGCLSSNKARLCSVCLTEMRQLK